MDEGLRLKKWSEKMGYVHSNGYDTGSPSDFSKLCKGKAGRVWDDVQVRVNPLSHVEHIRKNIMLSRIRKGDRDSILQLSGSLIHQVKIRQELQQIREQKEALCNELSTLESSIKSMQRSITKKHTQASFIQNQLKQFRLKSEMIKIKKKDCEVFKTSLDGLNASANSLLSSGGELSKLPEKDVTSIRIEKCMKLVKDYQAWREESTKAGSILEEEEYQTKEKLKKEALWKNLSASLGNVPPEKFWNCVLSLSMEKNVQGMASLAASVDVREELNALSREKAVNGMPLHRDLSAMYVASMTATARHLVDAEVLDRKVDLLLEDIVDGAQVNIHAESNVNKSLHFSRGRMLEFLRLRCRKIRLETVKAVLMDEVNQLKVKTGDIVVCAPRLKQEQITVARLDSEIEETRMSVEQGLRSIYEIKNNLRKAQKNVLDVLDSFAERCTVAKDIVSTRNEDDTINSTFSSTSSSTHRYTVLNNTVLSNEDTFVCSTPAPVFPNIPAPARRALFASEETALADVSMASMTARTNIRGIISTLRNAVSKESKTFFKLPLDLVPKVKLSMCTENISNLLVESPALIAQLACSGGPAPRQLALLSPFMVTDSQLLILHVFQNLSHLRAARLQQLLSTASPPAAQCAELTLQYLEITVPDQESNLRENLSEILTSIENTKEGVSENKELFDIWVRRSVEDMVPDSLEVDGKSLKEWKTKYDTIVAQLK